MRRTYRRRVEKPTGPVYQVNRNIKAPEVRLVDETGTNVGVVSTAEALKRAEEASLDLVEVSPLAKPPVAKILDFHQFKYQHDKEAQKAKVRQKKQEIKGVRLSFRISDHDFDLRLNQAVKFLGDNHKLKVELILRGREHKYKDKATEVLTRFIERLKEYHKITIEQPVQKQGGRLSLICFTTGKVTPQKDSDIKVN